MRRVIKKEAQEVSSNLIWIVVVALTFIYMIPALSEGGESDTTVNKNQKYIKKEFLKTDASGEPIKDESGNFIFVPIYEPVPDEEPLVELPPIQTSVITPTFRSKLQKETVYIGPEIYTYRYKEPSVMENEGIFYGLNISCISRDWVSASSSNGGSVFKAEGRFAFGQVDYDGALSDGTPYKIDGINDLVLEGRLLLGVDMLFRDILGTLYSGVGYRYLNDDTSFDPYGYERESNYLYIPLRGEVYTNLKANWYWGAGIEFDYLAWGMQNSQLSDYDPALPDIHHSQNSGYGYRASIRFEHRGKKEVFAIEPFFRYWDIDDSEIKYGTLEPSNDTKEIGVQLFWIF